MNGDKELHVGSCAETDAAKPFEEPSAKNAPDTELSNNDVPETVVNGVVDGVKVVVYKAVPFTILTLETDPLIAPLLFAPFAMNTGDAPPQV